MSSATSDSAQSAHALQQGRTGSSEESFALLVKPFDSVEDDGDLHASRAYPKVLNITSSTDSPTNKDADVGALGRYDDNSHRPWPKQDTHQIGSKRKRENIKPDLPALQQDDRPLQRWLHEVLTEGTYHGIADTGENTCVPHAAKDNTKKY